MYDHQKPPEADLLEKIKKLAVERDELKEALISGDKVAVTYRSLANQREAEAKRLREVLDHLKDWAQVWKNWGMLEAIEAALAPTDEADNHHE